VTDPERSRLIARTPKKAIRSRKFLFDANTFEYMYLTANLTLNGAAIWAFYIN
jgi:hypothetical protein